MRKFWTWLDGRKTGIAVVVTIALGALEHYGAALPPWVQDATYALLGLGVAHKAVKALPTKARAAAAAVGLLALFPGCQALGQALGVQPSADAPAYHGVGVVVLGSANEARVTDRADQSGAVGATGSAAAEASQILEIPQEVVEQIISAAQALIAAGRPEAAGMVLNVLKSKRSGAEEAITPFPLLNKAPSEPPTTPTTEPPR